MRYARALEGRMVHPMAGVHTNENNSDWRVVIQIDEGNIKLLSDTWLQQVISQDVFGDLDKYYRHIAHIQITDFPGRYEPGTGEINFDEFLYEIGDCKRETTALGWDVNAIRLKIRSADLAA